MPKWISVEEAAAKYGINKEVIWLWADMKRFPMSYEKGDVYKRQGNSLW